MPLHGGTGAQLVETFTSEWDLSAKQYRAVHIGGTDNYVRVCSTSNIRAIGVLMNKPTSGEAARVCLYGYCKVQAGDTVTRGTAVVANSFGMMMNQVAASSGYIVGVPCESVASGSIFGMIVSPYFQTAP